MNYGRTIAAISTGRSAAGIGVIRISGSEAFAVADRIFTSVSGVKIADTKGYRAHYGTVHDAESGNEYPWHDDAVALVFRGPKSYTGENVVEISCHGGSASTELALAACIDAGAYPAAPGEFTRRAFENGKLSLTQAEAVMNVISAEGRQTAVTAQAVLDGRLNKRIDVICDKLKDLAVKISAWCDYPDEEEIPAVTDEELSGCLTECKNELKALCDQGKSAILAENGIETVICGKPNVGKSTLMNLLAGRQKSIVTDIAGTTRDIIDCNVSVDGCHLHLYDTAGIRETNSIIEKMGVDLAKQRLDIASLVLFVVDGSEKTDDEDIAIYELIRNMNCIGIINKTDKEQVFDKNFTEKEFIWVEMCADTGEGLDELANRIKEITGINRLDPSIGNIINRRQLYCVKKAYESIENALKDHEYGMTYDVLNVLIYDALDALYELNGKKVNDSIIEDIFSKFCVGK